MTLRAQTVDVIRGRVTGPDREVLEGVGVTVTPLSGAVSRNTRTDCGARIPAGRVIAGFGAGGVVYMGVREEQGVRLEQARRTAAPP